MSENGALSGSAKFVPEDYKAGKREKKPSLVRKLNGAGKKVALLDLGMKDNIAYSLKQEDVMSLFIRQRHQPQKLLQQIPMALCFLMVLAIQRNALLL